MSKAVHKYRMVGTFGDINSINMPNGSVVVHAERQTDDLCIWAERDTQVLTAVIRRFCVYGTGHTIPSDAQHITTWKEPPYVWHLYELFGD